jgi:streptomycin 6-kinase
VSTARSSLTDAVLAKALAVGAEQWVAGLPGLVADLERDWQMSAGPPYEDATEAYVAEATLADGTPAVLKVHIPRPGDPPAGGLAGREITFLELAGGEGCARLLRADRVRGALLLERLGPSLRELGLPIEQRHEILCAAVSRLWRPVPGFEAGLDLPSGVRVDLPSGAAADLPSGADRARGFAERIPVDWEELGRPCSEIAVAHALMCAARRFAAHHDERAVLVHGDAHEWNALLASDQTVKLIDPDGLLAEPECDLGVLMREDPVDLMHGDPRDRARWLGRRCVLNATAIWEWGAADRVATGLLLTRIGLQPVARQMLAAADYAATFIDL